MGQLSPRYDRSIISFWAVAWLSGYAFPATNITSNVSSNTTWTVAGSPYVVTGDIEVAADLTIEPGVTVKFNSGARVTVGFNIDFKGSIRAVGEPNKRIIFTSNQSTPSSGDWGGIDLTLATDSAKTIFAHCVFEYGGGGRKAILDIAGASPILRNCEIKNSASSGLVIVSGKPSITSCLFVGNRLAGIELGLLSEGSVIRSNLFQGNRSYPVITQANSLGTLKLNTFVGNSTNAIQIIGGTVASTQLVSNMGVPYVVTGRSVEISSGAELTIDSGVILKFDSGNGLIAGSPFGNDGILRAVGEASNPILFTSNQANPSPGDWLGIEINGGPLPSTLEYCILEYGGQDGRGNLSLNTGSVTIKNCSIRNSGSDGILVKSTFGGSHTITNNNIHDNKRFDLNNTTPDLVVAKGTWWGSAQGSRSTNGNVDTSNHLISPVLIGFPRSPFLLFFAHFAAGGGWKTLLFLSNLELVSTTVEVAFFSDSGSPLSVAIEGSTASSFSFAVPANGMRLVEVTGNELRSGWIEVFPRQRVAGSLVFQFVSDGRVLSAAGVLPGELGRQFSISMVNSRSAGASIGFAVANPNSDALKITVELYNESGVKSAETTITVGANGHLARFVQDLFAQAADWKGYMKLSAELGFAIVPLKIDGLVISTVPSIRLK